MGEMKIGQIALVGRVHAHGGNPYSVLERERSDFERREEGRRCI